MNSLLKLATIGGVVASANAFSNNRISFSSSRGIENSNSQGLNLSQKDTSMDELFTKEELEKFNEEILKDIKEQKKIGAKLKDTPSKRYYEYEYMPESPKNIQDYLNIQTTQIKRQWGFPR